MAQLHRTAYLFAQAFWLHVLGVRGLDRWDLLLAGMAFALIAILWTLLSLRAWMPPLILGAGALCFLADWQMLVLVDRVGISHGRIGSGLWLALLGRVVVLIATSGMGFLGLGLRPLLRNRASWHLGGWIIVAGQIVTSLLFLDMWVIEPLSLSVSKVELVSEKLVAAAPPVRIVQISDIHMVTYGPRERKVVNRVNRLRPDLVLLTGDYVNELEERSYLALRDMVGALVAPHGVYAVTGNIDLSVDLIESKAFQPTGVQLLNNEIVELTVRGHGVEIVGVSAHGSVIRAMDLMRDLRADVPESYRVLMFHYPDFAEGASQAHVDLYLAGHTHGGQVRLPPYGALLTDSLVIGDYQMGRYDVGGTTLFVSRGIGFSGGYEPQVRFRCPPEVVLVTLRGSGEE